MGTRERVDDILGWVLIYEGLVLIARRIHPPLRFPPAVSNIVWSIRHRPARWAVAFSVGGYLIHHLANGDRVRT